MKLYSAKLSLFARKVEIALAEKGLAFERVLVPFNQTTGYSPKHPDVLAANPKGQVPVLIDGGLTLYDSTVILEYLDDAWPEPPLYPRAAAERARCRLWDVFADEVMLIPLRALMHRTGPRPADAALWTGWETTAAKAEVELAGHVATLDAELAGRAFVGGASISAADISLFMPVLYAMRLGGVALNEHPRVLRWYRALAHRPAFAKVVAEIIAADLELSAPVAGAWRGLA